MTISIHISHGALAALRRVAKSDAPTDSDLWHRDYLVRDVVRCAEMECARQDAEEECQRRADAEGPEVKAADNTKRPGRKGRK